MLDKNAPTPEQGLLSILTRARGLERRVARGLSISVQSDAQFKTFTLVRGWRLWKAGIVRENYARANEPGVVIVFECESVEQCKRYTDDFPLTKAGLLEWFHIPVQVPLPLETLFQSTVDLKQPYDRTSTKAGSETA